MPFAPVQECLDQAGHGNFAGPTAVSTASPSSSLGRPRLAEPLARCQPMSNAGWLSQDAVALTSSNSSAHGFEIPYQAFTYHPTEAPYDPHYFQLGRNPCTPLGFSPSTSCSTALSFGMDLSTDGFYGLLPVELQLPAFLETPMRCLTTEYDELRRFLRFNAQMLSYQHIRHILMRLWNIQSCVLDSENKQLVYAFEKLTHCMDLVLAVLLLRKLMDLEIISYGTNDPMEILDDDSPDILLFTVLPKVYSDLQIDTFLVEFHKLHGQGLFAFIAAVTVGEMELVTEEVKRYIKVLKTFSWQGQEELCRPLLLITAIAGNVENLDALLNLFKHQISGKSYCIASVCCRVSMWEHKFGTHTSEAVMHKLALHYESLLHGPQNPVLNFSTGIEEVIRYFTTDSIHSESFDKPAAVFSRYASFVFNSRVLADRFVQRMLGPYNWTCTFDILEKVGYLPRPILLLCLGAFNDLCGRGGAGSFLVLLQADDVLGLLSSMHRERLILYLMQSARVTQNRHPLINACELCSRPNASFLLWILSRTTPPPSGLDAEEIAGYCEDDTLNLFRRIQQLQNVCLCAFHRNRRPSLCVMARIIETYRSYMRNRTLKIFAVLSMLRGLGGDRCNLDMMKANKFLRKYFFLDYPYWVANGCTDG